MIRISIRDPRYIYPFNDYARDLRILNKPLWLHHSDVLAPYVEGERQTDSFEKIFTEEFFQFESDRSCIVYRDNLFFDEFYLKEFMEKARARNRACRAAFSPADPSFSEHALPLSTSYQPAGGLYLADLWYFPEGPVRENVEPLIIKLEAQEIGYYHVPTYMATQQGDLTFQVPMKAFIAIDSWVHIFIADMVFGLFARGARFERQLGEVGFKLRILATSLYEGKQLLESSQVVKIGENCVIDPTAIIHGPTTIGNNVTIGAGAVIENCIVGNNVNISQGCHLMLSVVGDGTFLPFRASLFMSTLMDTCMVAQNTCLQMCVVGRNTFIGAGNTFTDFNLIPIPIRALDGGGELRDANRPVLGGCVGHNCRIGSGIVISPSRVIESDVVIISSEERRVIDHNVTYEESDHHTYPAAGRHKRLYDPNRKSQESW
jgi:carbonic anhydrase/acetyltransferase-like protein (isoleucine patch superfamily)